MKRIIVVAVIVAVLAGVRGGAAQQTEAGTSFRSNVAITSDYAFRGISQTLRKAAIQGGVDVSGPAGLYAGVWGSSLNFGEDLTGGSRAQVELDLYAGVVLEVLNTEWELGIIYYGYPGAASRRKYDYVELGLGASRQLGPVAAAASFAYAPDFFAGSGSTAHAVGELQMPLISVFSLGLAVGHQTIGDHAAFGADDYTYWQVPLSAALSGFTLSVSYVATNLNRHECFAGSDLCNGRAIFTLAHSR